MTEPVSAVKTTPVAAPVAQPEVKKPEEVKAPVSTPVEVKKPESTGTVAGAGQATPPNVGQKLYIVA